MLQEQALVDKQRKADIINQLERDLSEANTVLEATQAALRDRSGDADLQGEVRQMTNDKQVLKRDCDRLRQELEISILREDNLKREAQCSPSRLEREMVSIKSELKKTRDDLRAMQDLYDKKVNDLERAEDRLSQRDREFRRMKEDLSGLEEAVKKSRTEAERNLAGIKHMENRDQKLRVEIERMADAKKIVEAEMENLESQVGGLKNVIVRMQKYTEKGSTR